MRAHVLVVDDSLSVRKDLETDLAEYEVTSVASGEEALAQLGQRPFDAILMDLEMPGLSGKEACRRIKAQAAWRDIPLMIHTAQAESEALQECIDAGADDFVIKSSDHEVLNARLKAHLRRRQYEDENRNFRLQLAEQNADLLRAREEAVNLAKEISSFSYSVSHDLRAPLRSINGFSRALLEDCGGTLDAGCRRHLDRVLAAATRMEQLIDDMLSLAKVSSRELAPVNVDLSGLVRELALELKDPQAAPLLVEIAPGMRLLADPGLLRILMQNLLDNAKKFSAKEARPRIEVFSKDGVVTVRDNGVGFDMAYADKLFGAFQRLHSAQEFSGTGIGLATAHRVVQRHGGRLWAESRPGHGASFHFTWQGDAWKKK